MSNYQQYPVHITLEIPNFLEYPNQAFVAGDSHTIDDLDCVIAIEKQNDSSVNILIDLSVSDKFKRVRARCLLGVFSETGDKLKSWEGEKEADTDGFFFVKQWTVPQPDKPFTFKFGLHVSAVLGMDNIWKFNFYDELFNAESNSKMIVFKEKDNQKVLFYTFKRLIMFHSSRLPISSKNVTVPASVSINMLEKCLQIAHGVQVRCSVKDVTKIRFIAKSLGLKNVTMYCERHRIESLNQVEVTDKMFQSTFIRDRRHLLVHLLKTLKSNKELKKVLETMDIQKMKSESMKRCTHFFFHNC